MSNTPNWGNLASGLGGVLTNFNNISKLFSASPLGGIGTILGLGGNLFNSIFGTDATQNASDFINLLYDAWKKFGLDPNKQYVTSEEIREPYNLNKARLDNAFAQTFQTTALQNAQQAQQALAQRGLSDTIGESSNNIRYSALSPATQKWDEYNSYLVSEYAKPLRKTYNYLAFSLPETLAGGIGKAFSETNRDREFQKESFQDFAGILTGIPAFNFSLQNRSLDELLKLYQSGVINRNELLNNLNNQT